MNRDTSFKDEESQPAGSGAGEGRTSGGATDIFGTVRPAATTPWATVGEPLPPAAAPPAAPEPPVARTPLPVVHDVVFKAPDAAPSSSTDPLLQLLRSSPPGPKRGEPLPPVPPPTPQPAPPPPTAASRGGFTQLLRALNYDEVKATPAPQPTPAPMPAPVPARVPASSSSITQLLRTIDQADPPAEAPRAVPSAQTTASPSPTRVPEAVRGLNESMAGSPPSRELNKVPGSLANRSPSQQVTSFRQTLPPVPPRGAAEPPPLVQAPPVAASTPVLPAASLSTPGSFTQLFGTLNAEEVPPPKEAVSATSETPPFPQMFEALGPPPSSAEPLEAKKEVPAATAGSFTQMFEALTVTPARAAEPKAHPVAPQPLTSPVRPMAETPVAPVTSVPGTFTQMFQTLDAPSEKVGKAEEMSPVPLTAPAVAASGPGAFTQMFSTPAVPAAPENKAEETAPVVVSSPEPFPVAKQPGSFTEMFRTLDAAAPEEAPPEPAVPSPSPGRPGSFTEMFSTPAAPAARADTVPDGGKQPGSFTQMFRTLDAPPAPPVLPPATSGNAPDAASPGSFKQMFRTLDAGPSEMPVPSQALPSATPASRPVAGTGAGPGAFTQMFNTLSSGPPAEIAPAPPPSPPMSPMSQGYGAGYPEPVRTQPASAPPSGGLTQLLRALDQPVRSAISEPSPGPSTMGTKPGAFTAAYGSLESMAPPSPPSQGFSPSPQAAAPIAPPVSAGPSEFTRILHASALRESALRGTEPAVGESAAPATAAAPAGVQAPAWTMPHAPAVPHAPPMPQVPHVKVPEVPKPTMPAAAAGGKMQQYLPLLLILVIFLLIAVLVAIFLLMKR